MYDWWTMLKGWSCRRFNSYYRSAEELRDSEEQLSNGNGAARTEATGEGEDRIERQRADGTRELNTVSSKRSSVLRALAFVERSEFNTGKLTIERCVVTQLSAVWLLENSESTFTNSAHTKLVLLSYVITLPESEPMNGYLIDLLCPVHMTPGAHVDARSIFEWLHFPSAWHRIENSNRIELRELSPIKWGLSALCWEGHNLRSAICPICPIFLFNLERVEKLCTTLQNARGEHKNSLISIKINIPEPRSRTSKQVCTVVLVQCTHHNSRWCRLVLCPRGVKQQ